MLRGCNYTLLLCGSAAAAGLTRCFLHLAQLPPEKCLVWEPTGRERWRALELCLPLCTVPASVLSVLTGLILPAEEWFLVGCLCRL